VRQGAAQAAQLEPEQVLAQALAEAQDLEAALKVGLEAALVATPAVALAQHPESAQVQPPDRAAVLVAAALVVAKAC
jgi:hypothetical protein